MAYPIGVNTFTAIVDAIGPDGNPQYGNWWVEIETPLAWSIDGTVILKVSTKIPTLAGHGTLKLPYTDQLGFTAGQGGAPVTGWGYRFYYQPTRSHLISSDTYVQVPTSLGPTVRVGNLLNIGAWPNRTVTVVTGGTTTGTPTYIQAPGMPAGYYVQA